MSDSNRGYRLATGLASIGLFVVAFGYGSYSYWLGSLSGQKEAETQNYQAEYGEHTDQRISRCFERVDRPRECVEKAVRDNYEQQRAESDLNAQRNMADWAFWLLVVSSAGLGVTAIGTAFLAYQVKLTREAVTDTGMATDAMVRQNELTELATQSQQRAYISIDQLGVRTRDDAHLAVRMKNFGQTPGKNVTLRVGLIASFADGEVHEVDRLPLAPLEIPPNQVITRGFRLPDETIMRLVSTLDEVGIKVHAIIDLAYEDIFGQSYKVTFIVTSEGDQYWRGEAGVLCQTSEETNETH